MGNYLPTPRHGKPVEVNAYWYNDLEIMKQFALLQQDNELAQHYAELADKVKEAFLLKFWNEEENCLKDVLSGNSEENQVRCNQVWVLSMPYTMLPKEKELCVLHKIKEELYTTAGLRTLSPRDNAFHDIYIGSMQERDRAYHQGTVWAFPLGAYYRAWMHQTRHLPIRQNWRKESKRFDTGWRKGVLDNWQKSMMALNLLFQEDVLLRPGV